MFIVALDATMLNVAIPDIVKDLGTSTSAVQSAVALYSLTMAARMVGAGRLGDMLGSKPRLPQALPSGEIRDRLPRMSPEACLRCPSRCNHPGNGYH